MISYLLWTYFPILHPNFSSAFNIDISAIHCRLFAIIGTCSTLPYTVCAPCNCNTLGSKTSSCDSKGKCTCKNKFYGTKCTDRDCEMSSWSTWSRCRCGYRDDKTRTRTVKTTALGKGKACPSTKDKGKCKMDPCDCSKMRPGYYGDRCDRRDCAWNTWSSWSNTCACPTPKYDDPTICHYRCVKSATPTKTRSRSKKVTRVGKGKGCSGSGTEKSNCGYVCKLDCYQEMGNWQCVYKKT